MKKLNKYEQIVHDRTIKYLEEHGATASVEIVSFLIPILKRAKFGLDDAERKLFCINFLRHMRKHSLVYSVGTKSFTQSGSVKKGACLVLDVKPAEQVKYVCDETLAAMQRQARHYLETRQPQMMGLKWSE